MLILYRKKGESILIGEDITISVVENSADGVRLAIDAPREISIFRKELVEAATVNREAVTADKTVNKDALLKMNEIMKKNK